MQAWKTLSRRTVLKWSKYLQVENHTVELPDGRVISDWPWVVIPAYVNMVVVTEQEEFLCFRQIKYAVQGTSLAAVGGYIEPNEEPLAAAKRELLEETGYVARDWVNLGDYVVEGNRGAGTAHLFLATGAHRVAEHDADDLEEQTPVLLNRPEIEAALAGGEFKVLAWAANFALALLYLDRLSAGCRKGP